MRRAAKVDGNQSEIVRYLRAMGASVYPTHVVGGGFPDIVVGYRGVNYLFEIKDPSQPPSRRKLTPEELAFHDGWGGQVAVVETVEDCVRVMGL